MLLLMFLLQSQWGLKQKQKFCFGFNANTGLSSLQESRQRRPCSVECTPHFASTYALVAGGYNRSRHFPLLPWFSSMALEISAGCTDPEHADCPSMNANQVRSGPTNQSESSGNFIN
jgi:hypothetical protein